MPVHRILKVLDRGSHTIEPGQIIEIDWLSPENIGRLEVVGAVAQVHGPPLGELPGWKRRSQRLASIGITTAVEFLEADAVTVGAHMERRTSTIGNWKKEVRKWLSPPKAKKGKG